MKSETAAEACRLYFDGLAPLEVHERLAEQGEFVALDVTERVVGDRLVFASVQMWLGEEAGADRMTSRAKRREKVDALLRELRGAGLSYPAISFVLGRYHGLSMAPETARERCAKLGMPKNEKKAALARKHLVGVA